MTTNYTGIIEGFQVITTMDNDITLHPSTARNLNRILDKLTEIFDIVELNALKQAFLDHTIAMNDPHGITIEDLSSEILTTLYDEWIIEGYSDTFNNFVNMFFHNIETATTDAELLGDSEELAVTVKTFHRLLYLFHTGPFYSHVPILEKMFIGKALKKSLVCGVNSLFINNMTYTNDIDYNYGTYMLDIDSNPISTDVTYVDIQNQVNTTYITMKRFVSNTNKLQIEISDGTNQDIIRVTISHHSHKFAISLTPDTISICRIDGTIPVISTTARVTDSVLFKEYLKDISIDNVNKFTFYTHVANDNEMAFLIT